MINILKYAGVALAIIVVLDSIWLNLIAKSFYKGQIESLINDNPKVLAAGMLYIILAAGLSFFVINPAIINANLSYAVLAGLFFGFITQASFDLANLAIIREWTISVTLVNLVWASMLSAAASWITYLIFI